MGDSLNSGLLRTSPPRGCLLLELERNVERDRDGMSSAVD